MMLKLHAKNGGHTMFQSDFRQGGQFYPLPPNQPTSIQKPNHNRVKMITRGRSHLSEKPKLRLIHASSVYTDEVSIQSTEFFQLMRRLDVGIETHKQTDKSAKIFMRPVFILSESIFFRRSLRQTKSSSLCINTANECLFI